MAEPHRILVGVIGAPHGVRGELRVKSYTAVPAAIGTYAPLTSQDGRRAFKMVRVRPLKDDMLVAAFEGVNSREAASALTNTRLYVDRAQLPEADEEEFYHADLVGLRVEGPDGAVLGHVVAIASFGAGDLLEIKPEAGDTWLVAFTKAFVPVVDISNGRVVLSAEALIDDDDADDVAPDAPS